jgi:hypothetical protein
VELAHFGRCSGKSVKKERGGLFLIRCFVLVGNIDTKIKVDRRLRLFEKRILRRIFGPKRDEVTREWKKLHKEELNDLYSSPNIIRVIESRRMRLAVLVVCIGYWKGVYRALAWKRERERPLGSLRRRWEDNIEIFRKWDVRVWTGSSWLRVVTDGGHL